MKTSSAMTSAAMPNSTALTRCTAFVRLSFVISSTLQYHGVRSRNADRPLLAGWPGRGINAPRPGFPNKARRRLVVSDNGARPLLALGGRWGVVHLVVLV